MWSTGLHVSRVHVIDGDFRGSPEGECDKQGVYVGVILHMHTVCVSVLSVCSICGTGGSPRLVHPHGFTKPARKVYHFRLRPLDERMVLQQTNTITYE